MNPVVDSFFKALEAGKTIADPEAWRQGAVTASVLGGFFTALFAFYHTGSLAYHWPPLPAMIDHPNKLAEFVLSAITIFNIMVHTATSPDMGMKQKGDK